MDVIPRHKWEILRYMGPPLPVLTALQKGVLRKQLEEKYCHRCGEYIYNPYRRRKIRHYHHRLSKARCQPLLKERLLLHTQSRLVEWTRRFHNVMRLVITPQDMDFYKTRMPRFLHRIPALRMWTMEEWNLLHPDIPVRVEDGLRRLVHNPPVDLLHTPNLVL